MNTRWRIVTDAYAGYEVQVKRWWWPFWMEHGFCNTHLSVTMAREYIERNSKTVVENYSPVEHPNP